MFTCKLINHGGNDGVLSIMLHANRPIVMDINFCFSMRISPNSLFTSFHCAGG